MNSPAISYYNHHLPWNSSLDRFFIRGFAVDDVMAPFYVRHGDKPGYQWPWLLIYFEDRVVINPGTSDEIECEKSLMIWPPAVIHHYGNSLRRWNHSWIIVNHPQMEELLKEHPLPIGRPFAIHARRCFEKYLQLLMEELELYPSDEYCQEKLLRLFLYDLHRLHNNSALFIPERVREMEEYLRANMNVPLSMEALARHFHLSAPHFNALFRQYYHMPPMHYLNGLRMNQAARLLRLYPYSCQEVAQLTGFSDSLYFSRRFRQFWGISPREYRRRSDSGV